MAKGDLIERILERMRQLEITQVELASACGLTQGHLSKVLYKKIKLAKKTKTKLTDWLAETEAQNQIDPSAFAQLLAAKLSLLSPSKRMQFMQFMELAEQLAS